MSLFSKLDIKNTLGFQLIAIVFSIYLGVTLTVTAIHMFLEYDNAKVEVTESLQDLGKVFAPGIAESLWNIDPEQLASILKGMVEVPIITDVVVTDVKGRATQASSVSPLNEEGSESASIPSGQERTASLRDLISYQYPITYVEDGELNEVGVVRIYSDNQVVFERVKQGFIYIIINAVIKTIALWVIFLIISRKLLSRPLFQFTTMTSQINLDNLENQEIRLDLSQKNELTELQTTFNKMLKTLLIEKKEINHLISNLRVLNDTGKTFAGLLNQNKVLTQTMDILKEKTNFQQGAIYLLDLQEKQMLKRWAFFLKEGASDFPKTLKLDAAMIAQATSDQNYFYASSLSKEEGIVISTQNVSSGLFCIPLLDGTKIRGLLGLSRSSRKEPLNEADHEFIQTLANIALTTLKTIQMIERIETQNEALRQTNRIKDEFLANISHELRTPMTGILGFAQRGIKRIDKAKDRSRERGPRTTRSQPPQRAGSEDYDKFLKYYTKIDESGQRLLLLLNNLLDLSKLEAGKMAYQMNSVSLMEPIELVAREMEGILKERDLNFEIIPTNIDLVAYFDQEKIAQVIRNFIVNAIKFTPDGKRITISFAATQLHKGRRKEDAELRSAVIVSVWNEGGNIPEDEFELIFDKFVQSRKTKTGAGGTGLGLPICKEIIKNHRGRIWVENNPEGGPVFNFCLMKDQEAHE